MAEPDESGDAGGTDERAAPPEAPIAAWGLARWSPRRLARWWTTNRAQAELALIGAVAIGGIVCMMIATAIVLIVRLRS